MSTSTGSLAETSFRRHAAVLWPSLLGLVIGALVLGAIFHPEAQAAVGVWIDSTAFGHCFFVLPIALYLAWERRRNLLALLDAGIRPQPFWPAALLILPLALVWLAAERIGVMEGRQLVAVAMLQVLAFGVLGLPLWRSMAVPLLYLFFLVPFGAFLTPALQGFTARFIDVGLGVLAIPHVVSADIIEIPAGAFRVAEACAGLRFLIASIAFGVLYACTMYRSPGRRVVFIAASIVVPIIANGFRALGIVVLGEILGSAEAAAVDHVLYGWLFFSIVTMLLILCGLPFREDQGPVAPVLPAPRPRPGYRMRNSATAMVVAVGLVLAAMGPATALWLDHASGVPAAGRLVRPRLAMAGCTAIPGTTVPGTGADVQQVACDGVRITVRAAVFSPRVSPGTLTQAERSFAGPGEAVTSSRVSDASGRGWRLVETTEPTRLYAIGVWAARNGAGAGGLAWRARQAFASTFGTQDTWQPILIAADVEGAGSLPQQAPDVLRRFIEAQPDLGSSPGVEQ